MKHCSAFCAGIWPFLLFPLLLLFVVVYFQWQSIERSISANAQASLADAHQWAGVENLYLGRDVLITGSAPNREAAEAAVAVASNAEGVRTATFVGNILKSPASLQVTLSEQLLLLNGEVDNASTIDAILKQAQRLMPNREIQNNLQINDNVGALNNHSGILNAAAKFNGSIDFDLKNNQLKYQAIVRSETGKSALQELVSRFLPDTSIEHQITVIVPKCQNEVKALLSSTKFHFRSNRAIISPESDTLLASISEHLRDCSDAEFELSGHTDSTGNPEANQLLSEQRANAVMSRLSELGINEDNFVVRGFGSSRPISDNTTSEGRAENRRIEFKITN